MNFNSGSYHYEWFDEPIFEKYVDVESPVYCDDCGQQTGTETYKQGVNQIGTKRTKRRVYGITTIMQENIMPKFIDSFFAESPITKRLLHN